MESKMNEETKIGFSDKIEPDEQFNKVAENNSKNLNLDPYSDSFFDSIRWTFPNWRFDSIQTVPMLDYTISPLFTAQNPPFDISKISIFKEYEPPQISIITTNQNDFISLSCTCGNPPAKQKVQWYNYLKIEHPGEKMPNRFRRFFMWLFAGIKFEKIN